MGGKGRGPRQGPPADQQQNALTAAAVHGVLTDDKKQTLIEATAAAKSFRDLCESSGIEPSNGWLEVRVERIDPRSGKALESNVGYIPLTEENPQDYILNTWGRRFGTATYTLRPVTVDKQRIPGASFLPMYIEVPEEIMLPPQQFTAAHVQQQPQAPPAPVDPEIQKAEQELKLLDLEAKRLVKERALKTAAKGDEETPSSHAYPYAGYPGMPGYGGGGGYPGLYDWWSKSNGKTGTEPAEDKAAEEMKKTRYEIEDTKKLFTDFIAKQEAKETREKADRIAEESRAEVKELRATVKDLAALIANPPQRQNQPDQLAVAIEKLGQLIVNPPNRVDPTLTAIDKLATGFQESIRTLQSSLTEGLRRREGEGGDTMQAIVLKSLLENKSSDRVIDMVTASAASKERDQAGMFDRFVHLFESLNKKEDPGQMAQMASVVTSLINSNLQASTAAAKDQIEFLSALKQNMDPASNRPWTDVVSGALRDYYTMVGQSERIKAHVAERALQAGAHGDNVLKYLGTGKEEKAAPAPAAPAAPAGKAVTGPVQTSGAPDTSAHDSEKGSPMFNFLAQKRQELSVVLGMIAVSVREKISPLRTADQIALTLHVSQEASGKQSPIVDMILGWIPFIKYPTLINKLLPLCGDLVDDEDKETLKSEAAIVWWRSFQEVLKDPVAANKAAEAALAQEKLASGEATDATTGGAGIPPEQNAAAQPQLVQPDAGANAQPVITQVVNAG